MQNKIIFRTVIEVLGKPREHIESSLREYLQKLKNDERYEVLQEGIVEPKKQEEGDLWTTFAEIEIGTEKVQDLISFGFEFMPSVVEIVEPKELKLGALDISDFLNDLQAKLHNVDMVAKQLKIENDSLKSNINIVLKNHILVSLRHNNLDSEQLSRLTGVHKDNLEDFLDQLIDEGRVDLKEGIYYLKEKHNK